MKYARNLRKRGRGASIGISAMAVLAGISMLAGCSLGSADATVSRLGNDGQPAPVSRADESSPRNQGGRAQRPQSDGETTLPGSESAPSTTQWDSETRGHHRRGRGGMHHESRGHMGRSQGHGRVLAGVTVGPVEAGAAAMKAYPGNQVAEIELELSDGAAVWAVKLVSSTQTSEVYVDVSDGQIVGQKDKSAKSNSKEYQRVNAAKLDFAEAIQKAVDAVPGGQAIEIEIDEHKGNPVWEVELLLPGHQKREVNVDATTGVVL